MLEHFHDHVERQLGPVQRWSLRLHLWLCSQCRKYLRSYKTTVKAEKAAFRDAGDAPQTIPDDLVASILSAAGIPPKTSNSNNTGNGPKP